MTARVDPEGNFLFRSMPFGTFTLVARVGGRPISRTVTLPAEPMIVRDVDFGALPPMVAHIASPSAQVASAASTSARVHHDGAFRVQAGAFREDRNARQLIGRLQGIGERPFTLATRGLTVVSVGPFETRQDALAASERLRRTGFDTFVTRR
jgi:cell division protein FtsN